MKSYFKSVLVCAGCLLAMAVIGGCQQSQPINPHPTYQNPESDPRAIARASDAANRPAPTDQGQSGAAGGSGGGSANY